MPKYPIVAVLWKDHIAFTRSPLTKDIGEQQKPTISFGIIVQDTPEFLIVTSDIERYNDRDDMTFTLIYKGTIVSVKKYGTIKISELRIL
jgi:hypothetical protein